MKVRKLFSPKDGETPAGGTPVSEPISTGNFPKKDADFLTLAKAADTKWAATPALTLLWVDEPTFKTWVTSYDTGLAARLAVGSNRPSQTQTLAQVNKSIDTAVKDVKVYIEKKFKKANAAAQFSRYGIVQENKSYNLPKDNDKRKMALTLMKDAIAADGFGAEEFGTAFWTTTIASFNTALKTTTDTAKASVIK